MFDFDMGKLLLIGVVALIFIPPKDLPNALRTLGRLIGQARRMASDFQSQFSEALREAELSQLKNDLHDLKTKASVESTFNRMADMLEAPSQSKPPQPAPTGLEIVEQAPKPPVMEPSSIENPLPEAPAPEPLPLPDASKLGPRKAP